MSLIRNIKWADKFGSESSRIYSAKFANPRKEFIVAGGADDHMTKVF